MIAIGLAVAITAGLMWKICYQIFMQTDGKTSGKWYSVSVFFEFIGKSSFIFSVGRALGWLIEWLWKVAP